jgi:hypothetical protein
VLLAALLLLAAVLLAALLLAAVLLLVPVPPEDAPRTVGGAGLLGRNHCR